MAKTGRHIYIIVVATVLAFMGCTGCADTGDAAAERPLMEDFGKTKTLADSLYSLMQFRDAYDLYLQLLDSKEARDDSEKRLNVLDALCNTSELSGHKDKEGKWLRQLLDLATETGNDYYRSSALMSMGQTVFFEGNRKKGVQYVGEAIGLMSNTDRADADHLTHGYLNVLTSMYSEMKDYDQALQTVERNLQLTIEGTRWGTAQNQQLIDRRMALAKKAALLARMGIKSSGSRQSTYFRRADSAYAAWQAVEYEGNHTRDYFIVDYMRRRGRYQEAVNIYNSLIQRIRLQGDTLGEMMNTAKWGLADTYHQMGHCEQAATLYEQVLEIQDTLKNRKARNTAQELAAIYHDKEQDEMIMRQEIVTTRQLAAIIIILVVLIGVAALAAVVIFKNRAMRRKNRVLTQQIAEALKYKRLYREEKYEKTAPPGSTPADLNLLTDEQLYQHINDVIIREHLFTVPGFGREVIMKRFQLSKERVGAVFAKGSKHTKMSTHILKLRLEYAALLLTDAPDKSIKQIAADSGFSSSAYFCQCFRLHYGMSPSDYRCEATGH